MNENEEILGNDSPRSMSDVEVLARRRGMLKLQHIAPLTSYTESLRGQGLGEVPEFDPADGGVDAQVLFLFEKPGRMTAEPLGSGFISRNNDDPTAEAIFKFMKQAGIARRLTVIWNVIPWWNGTTDVTKPELCKGIGCVKELISLMPNLRAVVLVGKKAAKAERYLRPIEQSILNSDHPSPKVKAKFRDRWNAIPREWAKVHEFLQQT